MIYGAWHKVELVERLKTPQLLGEKETSTELQTLQKFGRVCNWRRILRVKVQQVYSLTTLFQSQVCTRREINEKNCCGCCF